MTIDEFKKNIAPNLPKGYLTMDKLGNWTWWKIKPYILKNEQCHAWCVDGFIKCKQYKNVNFEIEPIEDWTKSLIKVGRK